MSERRIVTAFYDMQVSPVNLGVVMFAQLAVLHCRRYGFPELQVVIPPLKDADAENDGLTPIDRAGRQARMRNLTAPFFHLIPECRGILTLADREDIPRLWTHLSPEQVFPRNYAPDNLVQDWAWGGIQAAFLRGETFGGLTAPWEYQEWAGKFLDGLGGRDRAVTITLREEEAYGAANRNAVAQEWLALARLLRSEGYVVVFVRDTAKSVEPDGLYDEFPTCPMASQNILFRVALFENAYGNLLSAGGAGIVAFFAGVPYLQFNVVTEGYSWSNVEHNESRTGNAKDWNFPMSRMNQVAVWQLDTSENMREPVLEYLAGLPTMSNAVRGYQDENHRLNCERLALRDVQGRIPTMRYVFPEDIVTLEAIVRHGGALRDEAEEVLLTLKKMAGHSV